MRQLTDYGKWMRSYTSSTPTDVIQLHPSAQHSTTHKAIEVIQGDREVLERYDGDVTTSAIWNSPRDIGCHFGTGLVAALALES